MKQASNSFSIFRLTFIFNVLLILWLFSYLILSYFCLFPWYCILLIQSLCRQCWSHEHCTCLLVLILYDDQFGCFLLWFEICKFSTIRYFTWEFLCWHCCMLANWLWTPKCSTWADLSHASLQREVLVCQGFICFNGNTWNTRIMFRFVLRFSHNLFQLHPIVEVKHASFSCCWYCCTNLWTLLDAIWPICYASAWALSTFWPQESCHVYLLHFAKEKEKNIYCVQ